MYCSKCGKKIRDDAKFCDECGARITGPDDYTFFQKENYNNKDSREGRNFKCSACGELLSFDAIVCPSCGKDVREREVVSSVKTFVIKLNQIEDEDKRINMIKTFVVPNDRESIFELMLLSTSNLDVKYYATNRKKDSLASAWYTKIEQCYAKGKLLFTNEQDINKLNSMYQKIQNEINSIVKRKTIMIISGFVLIIASIITFGLVIYNNLKNDKPFSFYATLSMGFILLVFIGIVLIKFGLSRKKTKNEIELDREIKNKKRENRSNSVHNLGSGLVRNWKVTVPIAMIICGVIMVVVGFLLGEKSGNPDSAFYMIALVGMSVGMGGGSMMMIFHNKDKNDRED